MPTSDEIRKQIQNLVADDLPCIFLFFKENLGAINKRIKGVEKTGDMFWWENRYLYIQKNKQ